MDIASSNKQMWRGALSASLVATVIAIVFFTIYLGAPGFFGSALASYVVLIFFSVSIVVGILSRNSDPISVMALALMSYFTKLLLIALFLIAVTRLSEPDSLDRSAFGISALVISAAWLSGEVRAFFKLRLELPQPKSQSKE